MVILLMPVICYYYHKRHQKEGNIPDYYYAYMSANVRFFRSGYALQKLLNKKNGANLFKGSESGTLESLYKRLNIKIVQKEDIIDSLGRPIYYLGAENPPDSFKNSWGHFIIYGWGTDNKRDTYFTHWKEGGNFWGDISGDYIIYSDKRDYEKFKKYLNDENSDWIIEGTSEVIKIKVIESK